MHGAPAMHAYILHGPWSISGQCLRIYGPVFSKSRRGLRRLHRLRRLRRLHASLLLFNESKFDVCKTSNYLWRIFRNNALLWQPIPQKMASSEAINNAKQTCRIRLATSSFPMGLRWKKFSHRMEAWQVMGFAFGNLKNWWLAAFEAVEKQ